MAWTFCALFIPWVILVAIITGGRFPNGFNRPVIRFWGRTMLWISGIKLELDGCEALDRREARVITFNHASTLDVFIMAALLPPGGVPVVKREIVFIPFIGWGIYFMDFVRLDRRNRDRAVASLEQAAARIRDNAVTVMIAPEGTRTSTRDPAPFKLGAIRLAEYSGAPIIPLVIDGAAELWPRDQIYCTPGTVRIRLLEPITSQVFASESAQQVAEALRERYREDLGVANAQISHAA
ncbi:MAG: 1-acyl-sn-glycerol-3-phosphate acyltransferase [Bradymonadaceae bacterium]|nr:1-acyl-sn-glycerol-3-phosphate acyltransferase [Lujinxingiaceae bacterium]